jgi:hypothetical protein
MNMTKRKTTRITIELHIKGDPDEICGLVDEVLDQGTLQDAIAELASDLGYKAEVTSALVSDELRA